VKIDVHETVPHLFLAVQAALLRLQAGSAAPTGAAAKPSVSGNGTASPSPLKDILAPANPGLVSQLEESSR
jgi:hypothetical protein